MSDDRKDHPVGFEALISRQKEIEPQFLYWQRGMELELSTLQFVKSIRNADFDLFLDTLIAVGVCCGQNITNAI